MSLGADALKAGGAGQQFWRREGGIHHNPASGYHPGTVTLIQSVEYLLIPCTYPWEGRCLTFADCRLQTADCRLQTTDCRLQTTDYRLHTVDLRL